MTDPIPASEIEAIRERHEEAEKIYAPLGKRAASHADRATLMRALDAMAEENARLRQALNTIGHSLVCAPTDYAEHNASELLKAGNIARAALKETGQ